MKTQKISIGQIKLNPSNPRIIKDEKFKKLVKSIQEFPEMKEVRPIVVNKDMVILGGNMRFRAMQQAGVKEVPVVIVDWNEEKQKEFTIKDNLSFGDWDWSELANSWDVDSLETWGLDIPSFSNNILEPEIDKDLLAERMDSYINNTIKQIVLYYETEKYIDILKELDKIAENEGFADNSEAVEFLIKKYRQ